MRLDNLEHALMLTLVRRLGNRVEIPEAEFRGALDALRSGWRLRIDAGTDDSSPMIVEATKEEPPARPAPSIHVEVHLLELQETREVCPDCGSRYCPKQLRREKAEREAAPTAGEA